MSRNTATVVMPAGQYYIGDLCYVMHPEWDEFCNITIDAQHRCLNGKFTLKDGRSFVTMNTAYGDGEYPASNGAKLGVDAGLIGCIRVDDIAVAERENIHLGTVVDFPSDFACYSIDGTLTFGHIYITTGDTDDEDDYSDGDEY